MIPFKKPTFYFLVIGFSCVVSLYNIGLTPVAWQDEVQIVDLGNVVLDREFEESAVIRHTEGERHHIFSFLGPVANNIAFHGLPGYFGHRVIQILFGVFGALMLYVISRNRLGGFVGAAVALLWFTEPSFVQSYRGGRVDAMAMFFVLLSGWLSQSDESWNSRKQFLSDVVAGISFGLAVFSWVSAVICLPYVAYSMFMGQKSLSVVKIIKKLASFGLGGLLCVLVWYLLNPEYLEVSLKHTLLDASSVAGSSSGGAIRDSLLKLWSASKMSFPLVFLLIWFLVSQKIAVRRKIVDVVVIILSVLIVFQLRMYVHRWIYCLPVFFAILTSRLSPIKNDSLPVPMVLVVIAQVLISLVARDGLALAERTNRDYGKVLDAVQVLGIAEGDVVYDESWSFYFASKSCGYHVRRFWDSSVNPENIFILDGVDWFICAKTEPRLSDALIDEGFHLVSKEIDSGSHPEWEVWSKFTD